MEAGTRVKINTTSLGLQHLKDRLGTVEGPAFGNAFESYNVRVDNDDEARVRWFHPEELTPVEERIYHIRKVFETVEVFVVRVDAPIGSITDNHEWEEKAQRVADTQLYVALENDTPLLFHKEYDEPGVREIEIELYNPNHHGPLLGEDDKEPEEEHDFEKGSGAY